MQAHHQVDSIEIGLRDVPELEAEASSIEPSCERLALGDDVGLQVQPQQVHLPAVDAGQQVVERKR